MSTTRAPSLIQSRAEDEEPTNQIAKDERFSLELGSSPVINVRASLAQCSKLPQKERIHFIGN
jgi:hypothetical protein